MEKSAPTVKSKLLAREFMGLGGEEMRGGIRI
jgi:hypothetical protein